MAGSEPQIDNGAIARELPLEAVGTLGARGVDIAVDVFQAPLLTGICKTNCWTLWTLSGSAASR